VRAFFAIVAALAAASLATADTVRIEAERDATIIQDPAGAWANGSGPVLFAGRTNQGANSIRRGLLVFDVASALPAKAIVERVAVTLYMTPSHPEPRRVGLYRMQSDWSEGPSASSGGGGMTSQPGDVTWIHTFYDTQTWHHEGGDFIGRASAIEEVVDSGFYTWSDTAWLKDDVRFWASAPRRNFGWILIGDEGTPGSVKSFSSREEPDPALRPVLEITYRMPGEPPED